MDCAASLSTSMGGKHETYWGEHKSKRLDGLIKGELDPKVANDAATGGGVPGTGDGMPISTGPIPDGIALEPAPTEDFMFSSLAGEVAVDVGESDIAKEAVVADGEAGINAAPE